MKIRSVGVELLFADRRTDMMKLIVAFRNFERAPKNAQKNAWNIRSFQMFFFRFKNVMFFSITYKLIIHADLQRVPAAAYRAAIGRAMKITINAEVRFVSWYNSIPPYVCLVWCFAQGP